MTVTTTCPTCGRAPRRTLADRVVAGERDPKRAPRLFAGWDAIVRQVDAEPGISAVELREILADRVGLAGKTVDHLIRAAVDAGLMHKSYAVDGAPRVRRAYVWPGAGEAS